jgi:hypothetical protein
MSDRSPLVHAYAALVRLYPRQFRDDYGNAMVALLEEQRADEPIARIAARALIDLAITVPSQHLERAMQRPSNTFVPIIYAGVALAGLGVAVIGDTQPPRFLVGLAIAVSAIALGLIAWLRSRPLTIPDLDRSTSSQWWVFVLAGPSLAGAVILAAGLGVEAWFLGMAMLLLAALLTAVGIVLGLMQAASHRRTGLAT